MNDVDDQSPEGNRHRRSASAGRADAATPADYARFGCTPDAPVKAIMTSIVFSGNVSNDDALSAMAIMHELLPRATDLERLLIAPLVAEPGEEFEGVNPRHILRDRVRNQSYISAWTAVELATASLQQRPAAPRDTQLITTTVSRSFGSAIAEMLEPVLLIKGNAPPFIVLAPSHRHIVDRIASFIRHLPTDFSAGVEMSDLLRAFHASHHSRKLQRALRPDGSRVDGESIFSTDALSQCYNSRFRADLLLVVTFVIFETLAVPAGITAPMIMQTLLNDSWDQVRRLTQAEWFAGVRCDEDVAEALRPLWNTTQSSLRLLPDQLDMLRSSRFHFNSVPEHTQGAAAAPTSHTPPSSPLPDRGAREDFCTSCGGHRHRQAQCRFKLVWKRLRLDVPDALWNDEAGKEKLIQSVVEGRGTIGLVAKSATEMQPARPAAKTGFKRQR